MTAKQIELGNIYKIMLGELEGIFDEKAYKALGIQAAILKWNTARNNLAFNAEVEIGMLQSEWAEGLSALTYINNNPDLDKSSEEYLGYIYEYIDGLCDTYVVFTGTLAKSGRLGIDLPKELLEWLPIYQEIPAEIKDLGYDFYKCMEETIKEISSRKQNPEQKAKWENSTEPIVEKWLKDVEQDPSTLYKADYSTCKIV